MAVAIFARICLKKGRADLAVLELQEALHSANIPESEYKIFETLLEELHASRR